MSDSISYTSVGCILTLDDIENEQSGNNARIAKEALAVGQDFVTGLPLQGLSKKDKKKRRELKKRCFNHMMEHYKPSEFVIPSIILWFVIRQVLWWLAEKIIRNYLDWPA